MTLIDNPQIDEAVIGLYFRPGKIIPTFAGRLVRVRAEIENEDDYEAMKMVNGPEPCMLTMSPAGLRRALDQWMKARREIYEQYKEPCGKMGRWAGYAPSISLSSRRTSGSM
jgi:hypothetical protein